MSGQGLPSVLLLLLSAKASNTKILNNTTLCLLRSQPLEPRSDELMFSCR